MPYFYTMRSNKLGYEEFEETLLELTSEHILNNSYIEKYPDFCNNLFFDLWREYDKAENNLNVRHYSTLLEIFFSNLFMFDSSGKKVNEVRL